MGQAHQEADTAGKLVHPRGAGGPRNVRVDLPLLMAPQSHPDIIRVQGPASTASKRPLVWKRYVYIFRNHSPSVSFKTLPLCVIRYRAQASGLLGTSSHPTLRKELTRRERNVRRDGGGQAELFIMRQPREKQRKRGWVSKQFVDLEAIKLVEERRFKVK